MSQILINDDLKQLDLIQRASGSQRETTVSMETAQIVAAMKAAQR